VCTSNSTGIRVVGFLQFSNTLHSQNTSITEGGLVPQTRNDPSAGTLKDYETTALNKINNKRHIKLPKEIHLNNVVPARNSNASAREDSALRN